MSYDALQWILITLAVAASAIHAVRKLAPNALRRTRTRLALIFLRPDSGALSRKFGRWLAPKPTQSAACGSGTCNSCAPTK